MRKILYLLAGGKAKRFGEDKLLKPLGQDLVFTYILKKFISFNIFDIIVLVCDDEKRKLIKREGIENIFIATAGKERIDSIRSAFLVIPPNEKDIVLIHDAARPNVSKDIVSRVIIGTKLHGNSFPAVIINDTVRYLDENESRTIDRNNLYLIQTPQGFSFEILNQILSYNTQGKDIIFDEGVIMEKLGLKIFLTEGDPFNIKITRPADYNHLMGIIK